MEKNNKLSKYNNGRIFTLFMAIVTVIGCSVLIVESAPFSRVSILPQISITLSNTFDEPFRSVVTMLSIVFPVAAYGVSFYFSKKQYKWLMLSLILVSLDAGSFAAFFAVELSKIEEGFPLTLAFDFIIELTFLVYIIKGYRAGKELNNDFSETPVEKIIEKDKNSKLYSYDKREAVRNKADKSNWLLLVILVTLAIVIMDLYIMTIIANTSVALAIVVFFVILAIACTAFVFLYIYLKPYVGVKNCYYYLKDGIVTRYSNVQASMIESFPNLHIVKKTESTYVCSYDANGKKKKLIIPKCFSGIERIIK